jgi:hypothetical protein
VFCRRLTKVREFDPELAADRAVILAQANEDAISREKNRAATNVLVREIRQLASRGTSILTIAQALASAPPAPAPARPWSILATPAYAGVESVAPRR